MGRASSVSQHLPVSLYEIGVGDKAGGVGGGSVRKHFDGRNYPRDGVRAGDPLIKCLHNQ